MCRNLITKDNKGFLLVEVLITIVILSVGLTSITRSMMTSLRALDAIEQYAEGCSLLEQKFWDMESEGEIEAGLQIEDNFPEPYEEFRYSLETENIKDDNEQGLLNQVKLSVSWSNKKERREFSLVTYLRNKKK